MVTIFNIFNHSQLGTKTFIKFYWTWTIYKALSWVKLAHQSWIHCHEMANKYCFLLETTQWIDSEAWKGVPNTPLYSLDLFFGDVKIQILIPWKTMKDIQL